jgi:hypothetical protein
MYRKKLLIIPKIAVLYFKTNFGISSALLAAIALVGEVKKKSRPKDRVGGGGGGGGRGGSAPSPPQLYLWVLCIYSYNPKIAHLFCRSLRNV